ncbi:MAG: hypothetical protein OXL68_21810 [Paracoccaceae bacterium]|nr:hypothetical protein [Paracoccaceae bacterium]
MADARLHDLRQASHAVVNGEGFCVAGAYWVIDGAATSTAAFISTTRCSARLPGGRTRMALAVRRRASYDSVMSEAIAFDTHRFVKRLTESGFTEQQAETLADEHVALLNANLATKADVARIEERIAKVEAGMEALRQETKAGMDALRQETRAAIEASKSDLMKWLVGLLIAQGGLIVALVKLL